MNVKQMIGEKSILSIQRRVLAAGLLVGATALFVGLVFGQATVNVTATINSTITCAGSTTTLPFGALSSAVINTTTPQYVSTTLACPNDANGCYLSLNDHGNTTTPGMYSTSTSHLIQSPAAGSTSTTSTIAAGTENYGAIASVTAATAGGALTLNPRYNFVAASNTIGAFSTTSITIASSSATTTGAAVLTYPEITINGTTQAGNYADTLTYSCTGN